MTEQRTGTTLPRWYPTTEEMRRRSHPMSNRTLKAKVKPSASSGQPPRDTLGKTSIEVTSAGLVINGRCHGGNWRQDGAGWRMTAYDGWRDDDLRALGGFVLYADASWTSVDPMGAAGWVLAHGNTAPDVARAGGLEILMCGSMPLSMSYAGSQELGAVFVALDALPSGCKLILRSDQLQVMGAYMPAELECSVARHAQVVHEWTRSHAGEPYNMLADRLAKTARQGRQPY